MKGLSKTQKSLRIPGLLTEIFIGSRGSQIAGVRLPGLLNFLPCAKYMWALTMEVASCHPHGACNLKVASTGLGKFVNSTSRPCGKVFSKVLKERVLEVAHFSKTSAGLSEMMWRHIPETHNVDSHGAGNLSSNMQVSTAQAEWHV